MQEKTEIVWDLGDELCHKSINYVGIMCNLVTIEKSSH